MGEDFTLIMIFLTIIIGLYFAYITDNEDQNLEESRQ